MSTTEPGELMDDYEPLVWRGSFTDDELDKALPPRAHWHEHAFSDSTQTLYLISVSPVAVELTAHNGRWQPGLAHMILLEGDHFTAVLPRAQQRAELTDHMRWENDRRPKMFETFNAPARRTIVLAQDQARAFNSDHIGTEHLLLSLVYEDTGVPAQSLGSLGITFRDVHTAVEKTIAVGQQPSSGGIPFTPWAKTVLELSLREADQLGHNYIGTEHLLLGLIAAADTGVKLLTSLTGLSSEELRRHVLDYLAAHPQPEVADMGELTFLTPTSVKRIRLTSEQLSLIAAAAIKAKTSIDIWITQRLLAAARAETSTDE
jgi:Clp amino terminal domain, pathogenicity island component